MHKTATLAQKVKIPMRVRREILSLNEPVKCPAYTPIFSLESISKTPMMKL